VIWLPLIFIALAQGGPKSAEPSSCTPHDIRSSLGPSGAGMGHVYNELIFQNAGDHTCRLEMAKLLFQRADGTDQQSSRVRRGDMPTKVYLNTAVNMDGKGSPQVILGPRQRTAVTTDWLSRTGFTETDICATKVRVKMAGQTGILLNVKTQACESRISVSGFHEVRE
jgi:hypothetical protein